MPFPVIDAGEVAGEFWQLISDPKIRSLPRGAGKVNQILDSTDILSYAGRGRAIARRRHAVADPATRKLTLAGRKRTAFRFD